MQICKKKIPKINLFRINSGPRFKLSACQKDISEVSFNPTDDMSHDWWFAILIKEAVYHFLDFWSRENNFKTSSCTNYDPDFSQCILYLSNFDKDRDTSIPKTTYIDNTLGIHLRCLYKLSKFMPRLGQKFYDQQMTLIDKAMKSC